MTDDTKHVPVSVWILTDSYNDYDQHGEYFVAVFAEKPTKEQLISSGVDAELCEHVLAGGGRIKTEHYWYDLTEHLLGAAAPSQQEPTAEAVAWMSPSGTGIWLSDFYEQQNGH